jgi:hypothetical protein
MHNRKLGLYDIPKLSFFLVTKAKPKLSLGRLSLLDNTIDHLVYYKDILIIL